MNPLPFEPLTTFFDFYEKQDATTREYIDTLLNQQKSNKNPFSDNQFPILALVSHKGERLVSERLFRFLRELAKQFGTLTHAEQSPWQSAKKKSAT